MGGRGGGVECSCGHNTESIGTKTIRPGHGMATFIGVGELFSEDRPLGTGRYRVEVTNRPSGLRHIEGTIDLDFQVMTMIVATNPKVTLHLEDGTRWDCSLTDNSGRLINRGQMGLYAP